MSDHLFPPDEILSFDRAAFNDILEGVRLDEREACARIADDDSNLNMIGGSTGNAKGTAMAIATVIRARGQKGER